MRTDIKAILDEITNPEELKTEGISVQEYIENREPFLVLEKENRELKEDRARLETKVNELSAKLESIEGKPESL